MAAGLLVRTLSIFPSNCPVCDASRFGQTGPFQGAPHRRLYGSALPHLVSVSLVREMQGIWAPPALFSGGAQLLVRRRRVMRVCLADVHSSVCPCPGDEH